MSPSIVARDWKRKYGFNVDLQRWMKSLNPRSDDWQPNMTFDKYINKLAEEQGLAPEAVKEMKERSVQFKALRKRADNYSDGIAEKLKERANAQVVKQQDGIALLGTEGRRIENTLTDVFSDAAATATVNGQVMSLADLFGVDVEDKDHKYKVSSVKLGRKFQQGAPQLLVTAEVTNDDGTRIVQKSIDGTQQQGVFNAYARSLASSNTPDERNTGHLMLGQMALGNKATLENVNLLPEGGQLPVYNNGRVSLNIVRNERGRWELRNKDGVKLPDPENSNIREFGSGEAAVAAVGKMINSRQ